MAEQDRNQWNEVDLIGGHPVLDFLNTTGGRTKLRNSERLTDFSVFLDWAVSADVLAQHEAHALDLRAKGDADAAHAALEDTLCFREAVHACLMAQQANLDWPEPHRSQVMQVIHRALLDAHLEGNGSVYRWTASIEHSDLMLPKARIVLLLESLLRSEDLARLRCCDRCSWLFIDRGRGRARRWCSMTSCGSRAKSARYYRRKAADSE